MSRKRKSPRATHAPRHEPAQTVTTVPVETVVLVITCCVWLACSGYLIAMIPRGDAPDEAAHLEYINRLAANWQFIDFREEPKGTETHQPPLYYASCALLSTATGGSLPALRLLSALCGLGLMLLTYQLARAWLPARSFWFHWACAACVGFLPMNLYICSAVNNDPLVNVLVAAGLLFLWRSRAAPLDMRGAVTCGALTGLAMLTKSTALALLAACLVLYGVEFLGNLRSDKRSMRVFGFLAAFLVIWGWWGVRNTVMYGDPLAAGAFSSLAAGAPAEGLGAPGLAYWLRFVAPYAWATLWGAYNHLIHPDDFLPVLWYAAFGPIVVLAAVGLVVRCRRGWAREMLPWLGALAAGMLVLLAGFIGFNLNVFQAQARYFFCFLPVMMIALCAGLMWAGRPVGRIGVAVLLVLLAYGSLEGVAWRMWFTGP